MSWIKRARQAAVTVFLALVVLALMAQAALADGDKYMWRPF
jgi:hypothetical protein